MRAMKSNLSYSLLTTLTLAASLALSIAAETRQTLDAPGFRPESKDAKAFLKALKTCRLEVLPVMVRSQEGTTTSAAAQESVVAFLKEKHWGNPTASALEVDMGAPEGKAQFGLFESDMKKIGQRVKGQKDADYFLAIVQLATPIPSGEVALGGIHVYVLNAKGQNAYSFLLNSHHKMFVEAGLKTAVTGTEGSQVLAMPGTKVALDALERQIREKAK